MVSLCAAGLLATWRRPASRLPSPYCLSRRRRGRLASRYSPAPSGLPVANVCTLCSCGQPAAHHQQL